MIISKDLLSCWLLVLVCSLSVPLCHSFCPSVCLCDDEILQVICEDVNLEVVPFTLNPSLQRLVLRRSKIKSIDTTLTYYAELLYADLSHNKLVAIQDKSFEKQSKMIELRLDLNKIAFVSNRTWRGLVRLEILSLRDNYIQQLDEGAFATTGKLRDLDLSQNRIESIHPRAFAGLPDLRSLNLGDNRLTYASMTLPAFLAPLSRLAEFNFASNELPLLPDGLFSYLSDLSVLHLNGCNIRNVSANAFRGLSQLRCLKLHDNLLSQVPTSSWLHLAHLEQLTLGQNNFVDIATDAFAPLVKLKQLELNAPAQLVNVDADAFRTNTDLQTLRLTNAKNLRRLPDELLTRSPNVRKLVLRDNALDSLPEKLVSWSQLQYLSTAGNPLACRCNMLWMRDFLRKKLQGARIPVTIDDANNATLSFELICWSPQNVHNQQLYTLTDDQLGCRMPLTSQSLVIVLACTAAVVLIIAILLLWRCRARLPCFKSKPKSTADTVGSKWKPASPTWGVAGAAGANSVSLIGHMRSSPEYHKACSNEEECFMRAVTLHNSLRPFPRTEL